MDAGGASDGGQVGARRGRGREAAARLQLLVVEHDVDEVRGRVARGGRERPQVHQERAVAVEHEHLPLWLAERQAEADRRGQAHRVVEVEEVRPVAQRVKLGRDAAHDGDHRAFTQMVVHRAQALEPRHRPASSISRRVNSKATGASDASAKAIASATCLFTSPASRISSWTTFSASSSGLV